MPKYPTPLEPLKALVHTFQKIFEIYIFDIYVQQKISIFFCQDWHFMCLMLGVWCVLVSADMGALAGPDPELGNWGGGQEAD